MWANVQLDSRPRPTPCTKGTTDLSRWWWDLTLFGEDVLA